MPEFTPPVAFISYSHRDDFSKLLADHAEEVLTANGFLVERYKNRNDLPESVNFDVTGLEWSLAKARACDVTVSIIIRSCYGWVVPEDALPEEEQHSAEMHKSMCRLEYEAAIKSGRAVFAMQEQQEKFEDLLEDEYQRYYSKSLKMWNDVPQKDRDALANFREFVQKGPSAVEFGNVANFRKRLKQLLEMWKAARRPAVRLPPDLPGGEVHSELIKRLADRFHSPGRVAVSAPRGMGATVAVCEAARTHKESTQLTSIFRVDVRGRGIDQIEQKLRDLVQVVNRGNALDDGATVGDIFGSSRNILILDGVDQPRIIDLLPGRDSDCTVVIITNTTNDTRVISQLEIAAEDQYSVPRLGKADSLRLLRDCLPDFIVNREPAAVEALAALLSGWPFGLREASFMILEEADFEATTDPVARVVQQVTALGIRVLDNDTDSDQMSIIQQLAGDRLPIATRQTLASLSTLPHFGFSTNAGAIALGVSPVEFVPTVTRLRRSLILNRVEQDLWMLEREPRELSLRDDSVASLRDQTRARLETYYLAKVDALTGHASANVDELLADAQLVISLTLAAVERDISLSRRYMAGICEIVRRTGNWTLQRQYVDRILRLAGHELGRERAYWLELRGLSLARAEQWRGAREDFQAALDIVQEQGPESSLPKLLTSMASAFAHEKKHDLAIDALQTALVLERERGRRGHGEAIVLHQLAHSLRFMQRHDEAVECLKESIQVGTARQDHSHLSMAYVTWARFSSDNSDWDEALDKLDLAERAAERDRNLHQLAFVAYQRGKVLQTAKRMESAATAFKEAVRRAERSSDWKLLYKTNVSYASVLQSLGDTETSTILYRKLIADENDVTSRLRHMFGLLLSVADDLGNDITNVIRQVTEDDGDSNPRLASMLLNISGRLLRDTNDNKAALNAYKKALEYSREVSDSRGISISIIGICLSLDAMGRAREAISLVRNRLQEAGCGLRSQANLLNHLGSLLNRAGEKDEALKCVSRCVEIEKELGGEENAELAYPLHTLGHLLIGQARFKEAAFPLRRALALEKSYGSEEGEMKVLHTLARALIGTHDWVEAELKLASSAQIAADLQVASPFHLCQVLRTHAKLLERSSYDAALDKYGESFLLATQAVADESHSNRQNWRLIRHCVLISADIARLHKANGDIKSAARYLIDAAQLSSDTNVLGAQLYAATCLADLQNEHEGFGDTLITLREAFTTAMSRQQDLQQDVEMLRLVGMLVAHLRARNRDEEVAEVLQETLQLEQFPRLQLLATRKLGLLYSNSRRRDNKTESLFRQQAEKFLRKEYYYGVRRILLDWVSVRGSRVDQSEALQLLQHWIDQLRSQGASVNDTFALVQRKAEVLRKLTRSEEALQECDIADELAESAESEHLVGVTTLLRARVCLDLGDEEQALDLVMKECERLEELGTAVGSEDSTFSHDGNVVSDHSVDVGRLLRRIDPERARTFLRKMSDAAKAVGDVKRVVIVARELARIQAGQNYVVEAQVDLAAAEKYAVERNDLEGQAFVWQEFGNFWRREAMHTNAQFSYGKCIGLRRSAGQPMRLVWSLRLASYHSRHNLADLEEALSYANEALQLQGQLQSPDDLVRTQMTVGALLRELERFDEADTILREAVENADQMTNHHLQGAARLTLAAAFHAMGRTEEARSELRHALIRLDGEESTNTYMFTLRTLANSLYTARRGPEAIQVLQQFLSTAEHFEYPLIEVYRAEAMLASAYRITGLLPEAMSRIEATKDSLARADEDESEGLTKAAKEQLMRSLRFRRATIELAMNRPAEALQDLERLDSERLRTHRFIEDAVDDVEFPRENFTARAKALAAQKDVEKCLQVLGESDQHLPEDPTQFAIYLMDRSRVHLLLGDVRKCRDDAEEALALCDHIDNDVGEQLTRAFAHNRLALVALLDVETDTALVHARQAMYHASRSGSISAIVNAAEMAARVFATNGDHEQAISVLDNAIKSQAKAFQEARIDDARVTKPSVTLHALMSECLSILGQSREAKEHEVEYRRRQHILEAGGIQFTAAELCLSPSATLEADGPAEPPAFEVGSPSHAKGSRVLATVESIRSEGTNIGVYARLEDGTTAFCPAREVFIVGTPRDPAGRFEIGKEYPFVVKSTHGMEGDADFTLTQTPFLEPLVEELQGEIVEGRITRSLQVENRAGVEVELESGELLRLVLRRDVGFGKDEHLKELWSGPSESRPTIRLRLVVQREPHLKLSGSANSLFEDAMEDFITKEEPVKAVVLSITNEQAFLWLTPGVVGVCPLTKLSLGGRPEHYLQRDKEVAVLVKSYKTGPVTLDRHTVLSRLLDQALEQGTVFRSRVAYIEQSGTFLLAELAPGITGRLNRKNIPGDLSTAEFAKRFPKNSWVNVSVSRSNHNAKGFREQGAPHRMDLAIVQEETGETFETGRPFADAVAEPTMSIGPVIEKALQEARASIEQFEKVE